MQNSAINSITIALNDDQKKSLKPLIEKVSEFSDNKKPGMLVAQIFPDQMICGVIPYRHAIEINKIRGGNGSTTGVIGDMFVIENKTTEEFEFPAINTVVSNEDLIKICERFGLTDYIKIIKENPPIKPFKSDGASFFPDEILGINIYPAAFLRDIGYWLGYPKDTEGRLTADNRLSHDVINLCGGSERLAWIMYQGVRVGGHPDTNLPWRYGFGR